MSQAPAAQIIQANTVNTKLVEASRNLIPQLSPRAQVPTAQELEELVRSSCNTVLMPREVQILKRRDEA